MCLIYIKGDNCTDKRHKTITIITEVYLSNDT